MFRVQRAAEELVRAHPTLTPSECALQLGIELVKSPSPPPAQPGLRSEYTAAPPRITLYTQGLRAPSSDIHTAAGKPISFEFLRELHVAHELFHHLEMLGHFGALTRAESEKGAHAFADYLVRLTLDSSIPQGWRRQAD
ncbi:MAG: hypothetical protein JXA57_12580 [Armatimonadetes bacterium]|nr:hypothetical protein [Armatimonadota bacterium]